MPVLLRTKLLFLLSLVGGGFAPLDGTCHWWVHREYVFSWSSNGDVLTQMMSDKNDSFHSYQFSDAGYLFFRNS